MWGGGQIGFLNPLFLALLVQAKRRKGKEMKKEEKESSVWNFQDIKVRKKRPNSPIICVFFLSWV